MVAGPVACGRWGLLGGRRRSGLLEYRGWGRRGTGGGWRIGGGAASAMGGGQAMGGARVRPPIHLSRGWRADGGWDQRGRSHQGRRCVKLVVVRTWLTRNGGQSS
jgi:hypothetical protein